MGVLGWKGIVRGCIAGCSHLTATGSISATSSEATEAKPVGHL